MSDNLTLSLTHLALGAVGASASLQVPFKKYCDFGMHANLGIYGMMGFFYYQGLNVANLYRISRLCAFYLPIPTLMGEIYRDNQNVSMAHVLSGIVPCVLEMFGEGEASLKDIVLIINLASLGYYSYNQKNEWGYMTLASAAVSYFLCTNSDLEVVFPLGLAAMAYGGYRLVYGQAPDLVPPDPRHRRT